MTAPIAVHGWTHSICTVCWNRRNPDRPARSTDDDGPGELEHCCFCMARTNAGIYVRHDPKPLACFSGLLP